MSLQSLLTSTRLLLIDTNTSAERWSNAELTDFISQGETYILRIRPDSDSRYTDENESVSFIAFQKQTDSTKDLTVDDTFKNALTYYAVSQALQKDNLDANNIQRSQEYLKRMQNELQLQ